MDWAKATGRRDKKYLIDWILCLIIEVSWYPLTTQLGVIFSIIGSHENGFLSHLKDVYFGQYLSAASCSNSVTASSSPVTMTLLLPGFILLGAGLALGLLVLLFECLMRRRFRGRRDNDRNSAQQGSDSNESPTLWIELNTLWAKQNECHFEDDI